MRSQGIGNGKRGMGNGERGTGNGETGKRGNGLTSLTWPEKEQAEHFQRVPFECAAGLGAGWLGWWVAGWAGWPFSDWTPHLPDGRTFPNGRAYFSDWTPHLPDGPVVVLGGS